MTVGWLQNKAMTLLRVLGDEKDDALKRIDSTIEQHVHTLHRRGTLLKNKVIDIYNEHVTALESDLEEVNMATTCIVSLKEYQEELIGQAMFHDLDRGLADLDEVHKNINEKIQPSESHIVYEDKHGVEKFRTAAQDLGRVRSAQSVAHSGLEGHAVKCTAPEADSIPVDTHKVPIISEGDANTEIFSATRYVKAYTSVDRKEELRLSFSAGLC